MFISRDLCCSQLCQNSHSAVGIQSHNSSKWQVYVTIKSSSVDELPVLTSSHPRFRKQYVRVVRKNIQSQQMRRKAAQCWLLEVIAIPHNSKQPWLPTQGLYKIDPDRIPTPRRPYHWNMKYWESLSFGNMSAGRLPMP